MKAAILFTGKFGSTEQYAQWIKEATNLPIFNLQEEKPDLKRFDTLILGSSIYVMKPYIKEWLNQHWPEIEGKKILLFTVSGTPPEAPQLKEWLSNHLAPEILSKIQYVPLRGKMVIRELPWFIRLVLRIGAWKEKDPETKQRMRYGFDFMDKGSIQPIVEWLQKQRKDKKTLAAV